jgi:hypothetical protein
LNLRGKVPRVKERGIYILDTNKIFKFPVYLNLNFSEILIKILQTKLTFVKKVDLNCQHLKSLHSLIFSIKC